MVKKKSCIAFIFCLILGSFSVSGQELRCNVIIDTDQLRTNQVTEKQIFADMQKTIAQFMNTRRWTNDNFTQDERINCNLVIRLTDMPSIKTFVGTAQIQSSRPVFGSDYESVLLNYIDREWQFEYTNAQPMDFNPNTFSSNLTSMLAFYAYVIIGLDYDSFSKFGGNTYLQQALTIANNAQQSVGTEKGWKAFEDTRNRYWLIENLMSQQMQPLREGLYTYHRQALDTFLSNPDQARAKILEVLNSLVKVNQLKPAAVLTNTFFDTKGNELINVFLQGSQQEKQNAYNVLVELDPTKTDRYEKLVK
ncbi:DUF4835 family protein [Rhodocytophaga rosea]|uniref:DUF4835 family protein n=1 Tax=Rhodocytophaga rosea TaxID=2704465 RepID=A0A6C0GIK6_9BACT|nr:DUF4835 family protein [Rhodocytophaga rosea]QHT67502.1 DUF4835 family protein [Rhodocytophaga rosea]